MSDWQRRIDEEEKAKRELEVIQRQRENTQRNLEVIQRQRENALSAYPNNRAARKAIRPQAKWRKAR